VDQLTTILSTMVAILAIIATVLRTDARTRRELKSELVEVKGRIEKLDDRVYALAARITPPLEPASSSTQKKQLTADQ
jgi:hypothetical protein